MLEIIAKVENGVIPYNESRNIGAYIKANEGKTLEITIKQYRNTRTCRQNAYYWGVVIPYIKEWFQTTHGITYHPDELHHALKMEVGKMTKAIILPNNSIHIIVDSTTRLSTVQFEEYLETLRVWCAEQGLVIPMPNEASEGLKDLEKATVDTLWGFQSKEELEAYRPAFNAVLQKFKGHEGRERLLKVAATVKSNFEEPAIEAKVEEPNKEPTE